MIVSTLPLRSLFVCVGGSDDSSREPSRPRLLLPGVCHHGLVEGRRHHSERQPVVLGDPGTQRPTLSQRVRARETVLSGRLRGLVPGDHTPKSWGAPQSVRLARQQGKVTSLVSFTVRYS